MKGKILNCTDRQNTYITYFIIVMSVLILAIESSCDDTSAAVVRDGVVLSNCVASQEAHRLYGGVVPEVASRAHQVHLIPVVDQALKEAGIEKTALSAIAFTRGPGLMGSLMVGVSFAKAMGLALHIPLIDVNHMRAHILAHFAEDPKPEFPFLSLTVSGGHTQLVVVRDFFEMTIIGQTIDDAAGEAFDKTGKLLGLDYPAGPLIDQLAQNGQPKFPFPEPKIEGLDFSFSGLKTSILYFLRKQIKAQPDFIKENLADICASVQHRIITILLNKLEQAVAQTGIKRVALAGGVSANSALRDGLKERALANQWEAFVPKFAYCTDNAAMVGVTAYYKYLIGQFAAQDVAPSPRLSMTL